MIAGLLRRLSLTMALATKHVRRTGTLARLRNGRSADGAGKARCQFGVGSYICDGFELHSVSPAGFRGLYRICRDKEPLWRVIQHVGRNPRLAGCRLRHRGTLDSSRLGERRIGVRDQR